LTTPDFAECFAATGLTARPDFEADLSVAAEAAAVAGRRADDFFTAPPPNFDTAAFDTAAFDTAAGFGRFASSLARPPPTFTDDDFTDDDFTDDDLTDDALTAGAFAPRDAFEPEDCFDFDLTLATALSPSVTGRLLQAGLRPAPEIRSSLVKLIRIATPVKPCEPDVDRDHAIAISFHHRTYA
jgi:hypothetical protein